MHNSVGVFFIYGRVSFALIDMIPHSEQYFLAIFFTLQALMINLPVPPFIYRYLIVCRYRILWTRVNPKHV